MFQDKSYILGSSMSYVCVCMDIKFKTKSYSIASDFQVFKVLNSLDMESNKHNIVTISKFVTIFGN